MSTGGNICPGGTTFFGIVLGVANREILKVLVFGVTPNVGALPALVGEPLSMTFEGD
jgi:hypothetical protein